jgi:hypothetical protein
MPRLSRTISSPAFTAAAAVLGVVLENGNLVIHRRPNASFVLSAADADYFESSLGAVHFLRNPIDRIVALSLIRDRPWDLRFTRKSAGAQGTARTAAASKSFRSQLP